MERGAIWKVAPVPKVDGRGIAMVRNEFGMVNMNEWE